MKKIIYFILISLFFIPFINANALDSSDVEFDIEHYYVQSDIDIAGSLNVKELIVLNGDFNGYVREIDWRNPNASKFTGKKSDFEGSDIYNASGIAHLKVGRVDIEGEDYKYEDLFKKITYFEEDNNASPGESKKYIVTKDENGVDVKMFNYTYDSTTAFYLEYTITNVAVKHKDVAELYYNFIGKDFTNELENVEIRLFLPEPDKSYKVWAHGPLNGTIYKSKDNKGAVLKCNNIPPKTPIDIRMTYDKDYYVVSLHKNTNVEALPEILSVEKQRAKEANEKRERAKAIMGTLKVIAIIYIILFVLLIIYIYIKYDKEYKSTFKGKYYRQIIEDYPPEVVGYLMNKTINANALNASLLNLIRKKNVTVEKNVDGKKDEYIFKLENKDKVSKSEEKLIEFLFNFVGDAKTFSTKDLKVRAKEHTSTKNLFYEAYTTWKDEVETNAIEQEFYIEGGKYKAIGIIYAIIGIALFVFNIWFKINAGILYLMLPFAIIMFIYTFTLKKRSVKGNEDYVKWKAFKRYLEDFGRFDEKNVPEVKLWEKLLVYAAVFGIADKVEKSMKNKFDQLYPNYDYNSSSMFLPYYFGYTGFASTINSSITSSLSVAQMSNTQLTSGSGGGGGFSGGGGFGGGGGGGHGF